MKPAPAPTKAPADDGGLIPEFLWRGTPESRETFKQMIDKIADKPEEKQEDIFD